MIGNIKQIKPIRLLTLFITILCLVSVNGSMNIKAENTSDITAASNIIPEKGMSEYAHSGDLTLYADASTGEFEVVNTKTGAVFKSNPDDRNADKRIKGVAKFRMYSQILLSAYDKSMDEERMFSSYTGSVLQQGLKAEKLDNGIRFYYTFPEIEITVPLDVKLADDKLCVLADITKIKENSTFVATQISLAPFFGCGGVSDSGYLVLPDGSGALAYFNNNKSNYSPYRQYVYGNDVAFMKKMSNGSVTQTAMLPLYGIKRNNDAFLAVISQGDGTASINAYTLGIENNQNTAYATFDIYGSDLVTIGSDNGTVKDIFKYNFSRNLTDKCEVDYYFLDRDQADYSSMAQKYSQVLRSQYKESSEYASKPNLYINLFSAYEKTESVFGFPVNKFVKLSDFNNAGKIIGKLKQNGVDNITLSMENWSKNEIKGKLQNKVSPLSGLGGGEGLKKLSQFLKSSSVDFYLSYNPLLIQKSGNGFSGIFDASKKISGEKIQVYKYKLSTYYLDSNFLPQYVPKIKKLNGYYESYSNSLNDKYKDTGMYSSVLSNMLYTDFTNNAVTTRNDMINTVTEILKSKKMKWMFNGANAYAIPYASVILNAPVMSSGFDLTDEDIPFYQLVISGICSYTLPCINSNPENKEKILLKMIETGSKPYFEWIYSDSSKVKDSSYNNLYSANYDAWIKDAVDLYQKSKTAFEQIGSAQLIRHEKLADGVYASVYKGGGTAVVNYSDKIYEYKGKSVKPSGFLIEKGGD